MSTKKGLKIFVDGYLLNKEHQGTKTYIRELYLEFAAQNPDILIVFGCFKDPSIEKEFSEFKNIRFIYFQQSSRVLRMFFEIPKIIKEQQFDFAHFQYVIPFLKSKSCKYIVTIHDVLFNDFKAYFSYQYRLKRNFLFKYSAKKSDFLLTVSNYSKERIKEYYKLRNKKILITPNGVNKSFFLSYSKKDAINYIQNKFGIKDYILYVSRIEPRKNQQGLLKAFFDLEETNTQIVFIGVKSLNNKELISLIASLSAAQKKRVHILKNISDSDLLLFYQAAKVFAYPTFAEGFGIPPLEAAALRIPVLCSNRTAMKDFDFFSPYFIDFNDLDATTKSLSKILKTQNPVHLNKIQTLIKDTYNWEVSSKVLTSIIKKKT
ncbi:glycosyltransferase family 4 protein [Polaribacter litorisediminis]|uniref:glycosyltransferase family 4 protein n=1 Tax=Polaribacter litorisediminis TaxID=1908341 RepID=UPI001CBDFD42|nr:glycosyltransferase family 1 protein [Polaribacter litorisediminis]UAM98223.1 glycosyltransferase family 4 protein [Polaribacter litorisediminis]